MAEITAALVKELRDATNLPMMKCKAALAETGGDITAAKELLRKEGEKFIEGRGERSTEEGRITLYSGVDKSTGAMIELQCESAPVASNEEFVQLGVDLAQQLATGPGAATPDELWSQPSPSRKGLTLAEQRDELANKIREVFRVPRIVRIDGTCGGYVHHDGKNGVLVEVEGGTDEIVKDVSMHIVALRPGAVSKEELDPATVAKEREILTEQARNEGKPENIIEKMVEGRMRNYYAEHALLEQPFVKDDKQTVGKYAAAGNMKIKQFVLWQLGG
jgi:elongation factor Ts